MSPRLGHIVAKPVLPVADMAVAVDFYRRLGLDVACYDDGYAWVRHRGDEVLHLRLVVDLDRAANSASAYLHVADADAWWEAMSSMGAAIDRPVDTPWGMREYSFTDPDGNLVRVGRNR